MFYDKVGIIAPEGEKVAILHEMKAFKMAYTDCPPLKLIKSNGPSKFVGTLKSLVINLTGEPINFNFSYCKGMRIWNNIDTITAAKTPFCIPTTTNKLCIPTTTNNVVRVGLQKNYKGNIEILGEFISKPYVIKDFSKPKDSSSTTVGSVSCMLPNNSIDTLFNSFGLDNGAIVLKSTNDPMMYQVESILPSKFPGNPYMNCESELIRKLTKNFVGVETLLYHLLYTAPHFEE